MNPALRGWARHLFGPLGLHLQGRGKGLGGVGEGGKEGKEGLEGTGKELIITSIVDWSSSAGTVVMGGAFPHLAGKGKNVVVMVDGKFLEFFVCAKSLILANSQLRKLSLGLNLSNPSDLLATDFPHVLIQRVYCCM